MSSPSPATSADEREEVKGENEEMKSPVKERKNNDEKSVSAEDKSGDDSGSKDEDSEVGLLDRPVEVTGSRKRKKVQRLELSFNTPSKEKHEIPEGHGVKLGDCPRIEHQLQKNSILELKIVHKVLFGRSGSGNEVKRNIRKFCGFTFNQDSPEYDKKRASLEKMSISNLKHICEVLDLERSGTKDELTNRIMEFTLHPKDSGKKVPKKKTPGRGMKRKREEKKVANVSSKREKAESSDDSNEDDCNDSSVNDESDEMSDEDKKKKSKTLKKKQGKLKKIQKNSEKKISNKKASSDDTSDDDDTPLGKLAKLPPTDAEIKTLVKKILQSADLQEITMKKVIKQVFDEYPDFDLSDKKEYIKTTVKSVIS